MSEGQQKTTILKLGGSVLTEKENPFTPNLSNLNRLAREIAGGFDPQHRRLVLVHGAGSFGHPITKRTGIHKGLLSPEDLVSFATVQRWQNQWNVIVVEALQNQQVPAIPIQPSSHAVMEKGRIVSFSLDVIEGVLELGMLPVLYGVPAYDKALGSTILSGDQIVSYLGEKLKADKVILGTNVDGLFTGDPKEEPDAELIETVTRKDLVEVRRYLVKPSGADVTGGMSGKFREIVRLAERGITCLIINAGTAGTVEAALTGEKVKGTLIRL